MPSAFERAHHRRIAALLGALNGPLLRANACLFGGGTAIALKHGEYRESVDLDFLVSDIAGYRNLRQLLTAPSGGAAIMRAGAAVPAQVREVRADQYGIRTALEVEDRPLKFEIVLEGRIHLATPSAGDEICGIATLTALDMATCKLLANSDRWSDDGTFNRDVIDLAMMRSKPALFRQAITKAEGAYGQSIRADLDKAIRRLQERPGWLERCMQMMAISLPRALIWKNVRALRKGLEAT
jgi:hypothetical protein